MVGAVLEASKQNVPVLVDGFICSMAAMIAYLINLFVRRALLLATESTEKSQSIALEYITIASTNDLPPPKGPALYMKLRMGKDMGGLVAVLLFLLCQTRLTHWAALQFI
ncbi:hypothetical protein ACHAWX_003985 [Stephanocyclus meneghinianus]